MHHLIELVIFQLFPDDGHDRLHQVSASINNYGIALCVKQLHNHPIHFLLPCHLGNCLHEIISLGYYGVVLELIHPDGGSAGEALKLTFILEAV